MILNTIFMLTVGAALSVNGCNSDLSNWSIGSGSADTVGAFIETKYPGARIVERDMDDGRMELEIWHGGHSKDVYFDYEGKWLYTTWDVFTLTLPGYVKQAASEKYPNYRIDDADYLQTPEGEFYSLELERYGQEVHFRVNVQK
jgi:hypothetical protein